MSSNNDILVKKEQNSFQTANKTQTVPAQLYQTKKLPRNATLQKIILLEVYLQIIRNNNKTVKWNPANWFRKENITKSDRANWSDKRQILTNKGLLETIESEGAALT